MVSDLPNPAVNLTDYALDNPMAFAKKNCILGRHSILMSQAEAILNSGIDPHRRVPISSVLPCVSLDNPTNYHILTRLLCDFFLDGLQFPMQAWLIFLSVCERMRRISTENNGVWDFWIEQILNHVRISPNFDGTGMKVPVLEAMFIFMTQSGLAPISRSPIQTLTMIQLLLQHGRVSQEWIEKIVPQILIRQQIESMRALVIQPENYQNLWNLYYQTNLSLVPIKGSAYLRPIERFLSPDIIEQLELFPRTYQLIPPPEESTLIGSFVLLLHERKNIRNFSVNSLLEEVLKSVNCRNIWNGNFNNEVDPIEELNSRFYLFADNDSAHTPVPPFVTFMGPSVLKCVCGYEFYPYEIRDITPSVIETIQENRRDHFRMVYQTGDKGRPSRHSASYNLHRTIQKVMNSNPTLEYTPELELEIVQRLIRDGRGNIHEPFLLESVRSATESYLKLRRSSISNTEEFRDSLNFSIAEKLAAELQMNKSSFS